MPPSFNVTRGRFYCKQTCMQSLFAMNNAVHRCEYGIYWTRVTENFHFYGLVHGFIERLLAETHPNMTASFFIWLTFKAFVTVFKTVIFYVKSGPVASRAKLPICFFISVRISCSNA